MLPDFIDETDGVEPANRPMRCLTFKYRLYPTAAQISFLNSQLREACELYNAALEERIGAWRLDRTNITFCDQSRQLKDMRADGCLTLSNFGCCNEVLKKLDRAFGDFFARVKRGDKPGFPRFKSSRRYDSITFPKCGDGFRLLDNRRLRIQGAGHIKIKLHRPVDGTIKTATIKREANKWFVCFAVDCYPHSLPHSAATIGLDLGITNFAVLSDGTNISNPRFERIGHPKIRIASRRVNRRTNKRSKRRHKAIIILQKAHRKVAKRRSDFHHKLSRDLVASFGMIAIEDLAIKNLASGYLAKSIHDVGWSQFIRFLTYKAENAGRELVKVDPKGTSQTCVCGERVPKQLKDRWHTCPACGLSAGRDHVSAQVILQRAGNRPSAANVEVPNSCVGREAPTSKRRGVHLRSVFKQNDRTAWLETL